MIRRSANSRAGLALLAALALGGRSFAGSAGTASFDFLTLDVGGRPLGMGGAFTGLADDMNAIHYNPAGLSGVSQAQASLFHRTWLASTGYSYLGAAGPLGGRGAVGASLLRVSGAPIDAFDDLGRLQGTINPAQTIASVSFGTAVLRVLQVGVSAKFAEEELAHGRTSLVLGDLGVLMPLGSLFSAGALVANLGSAPSGDALPLTARAGFAARTPGQSVQGIVEVAARAGYNPEAKLGAEYRVFSALALRAGYSAVLGGTTPGGAAGLSAGAGFRLESLALDYAFTPLGDLGNSHFLGLTYYGPDRRTSSPQASGKDAEPESDGLSGASSKDGQRPKTR